jgi:hypothetical protein
MRIIIFLELFQPWLRWVAMDCGEVVVVVVVTIRRDLP